MEAEANLGRERRERGSVKRLTYVYAPLSKKKKSDEPAPKCAARAEPRVYELSVPAVQCSYSSEKAEQAAHQAGAVAYAKADPRAHKLTVRFEDEETSLEAITTALAAKGYRVERHEQLR